jgi:peptidyl-prolyl cis-trans isomerase C
VMPPAFDQAAFSRGLGETSDVVETDYGFHLFKLLDRRPPRRKEFPEARREIEEKLLKTERAKAQEAYVKGLKEKADLRINEPLLQTLTAKAASAAAGTEK